MIFSAFEITGNLCVSVAFILFPGEKNFYRKENNSKILRSSIFNLYSVHHEGDVVEVGVGEGGQKADARAD